RHAGGRRAEEHGELADQRADQIDGLDVVALDQLADQVALLGVDHGEHHQRAKLGRLLEDLLELVLEADPRVQADLDRLAELQRRRADHALGGLAGGVADDHDRLHRLLYTTGRRTRGWPCRSWSTTRGHSGSGAARSPVTC